jgi:hypothetical protein
MGAGCRAVLLLQVFLFGLVVASSAHHSVQGQFDDSKSITLKGTISRVEWFNPHVYVHLDVKDSQGGVTRWALSTIPIAMLRRAGLTKESILGKPGEIVTIVAMPGRDARKRIGWISNVTYADGHYYRLFE